MPFHVSDMQKQKVLEARRERMWAVLWNGRTIETVSDYKLLYGEALSIGIVAEVQLEYRLG